MEVRHGSSRTVFMFRKFVVKVPAWGSWRLFLYGLIGNMHERAWGRHSDRLARVIWGDRHGFILVQERAEQPPSFTQKHLDSHRHLFDGLPVHDWKVSNFGFVGRRLVCLDYGIEKLPPFHDAEYYRRGDSYFVI